MTEAPAAAGCASAQQPAARTAPKRIARQGSDRRGSRAARQPLGDTHVRLRAVARSARSSASICWGWSKTSPRCSGGGRHRGRGLRAPAAVLFPRVAGVVELVAVELDGEVVLGPAAVDALAAGGAVGLGERESGLAQEREKALLELA